MLSNLHYPAATFELRDAGPDDSEFLEKLFREVKTREFVGLNLPAAALDQLLAMQFKTQQAAFALQFPSAFHQIVSVDGAPAGRIVTDVRDNIVFLIDIALLERHRGKGIGTQLLQHVCADATSRQASVKLTVHFNNSARRLYERAGFVQSGGDELHHIMEWKPLLSQLERSPIFPDQAQTDIADPMSSLYFSSLIGMTLSARSIDGTVADLVLEAVEPLRSANRPANAGVAAGDSFALIFTGPVRPVLPTAITQVSTASGSSMEIFLSPLGWTNGMLRYEAIFNRMGS